MVVEEYSHYSKSALQQLLRFTTNQYSHYVNGHRARSASKTMKTPNPATRYEYIWVYLGGVFGGTQFFTLAKPPLDVVRLACPDGACSSQ